MTTLSNPGLHVRQWIPFMQRWPNNGNEKSRGHSTRIHDLRGVQIKFILLNPRSHSAVLTGSVWIAPISLLIFLPETSAPFIFLKSLYSCFKSLVYGNKNLLHASLSSFSPYSDETASRRPRGGQQNANTFNCWSLRLWHKSCRNGISQNLIELAFVYFLS